MDNPRAKGLYPLTKNTMSVLELEEPKQQECELEDLTVKEAVQNLLEQLPDDVTWEQFEYHLYVVKTVMESEWRAEKNGCLSDEAARERLKKWLD